MNLNFPNLLSGAIPCPIRVSEVFHMLSCKLIHLPVPCISLMFHMYFLIRGQDFFSRNTANIEQKK